MGLRTGNAEHAYGYFQTTALLDLKDRRPQVICTLIGAPAAMDPVPTMRSPFGAWYQARRTAAGRRVVFRTAFPFSVTAFTNSDPRIRRVQQRFRGIPG